jgi:hypothetical protein
MNPALQQELSVSLQSPEILRFAQNDSRIIPALTKPALHRMVFRACPVLDTGESSL